jgi:hypothetical protein
MSTPRQRLPDALLKAALAQRAAGPSTRAELVDDVLAAVESLPQRRGWTWPLAPEQRLLPILLVAALLLSVLIGFGLAVGSPLQPDRDEVLPERGFVEPFDGLPPEGAVPSRPDSGELVLVFAGRVEGIDAHGMFLYADGRLIWKRNLDSRANTRAFGTTEPTTALIEQRLSPEGVELLWTAVLEAGRISRVPAREGDDWIGPGNGPGVWPWGGLLFNDGEQLVEMTWSDATLPARLADPGTWLPASAWVDQRIGGYVPTLYAVCFEPDLEDRLPGSVLALLASRSRGAIANDAACGHTVTIEEARLIAATLDDAGFARLPDRTLLEYRILPADDAERDAGDMSNVAIWFSPVLPHGELTCFGCG